METTVKNIENTNVVANVNETNMNQESTNQNINEMNNETINQNKTNMAKLNLLFIEGNRQEINKENVKTSYAKIKAHGFVATMPIEYITMEDAKDTIGNRLLFKPTVVSTKNEGEATISNFKVVMEVVKPEEYNNYDGICIDGQHRTIALMLGDIQDTVPTYAKVEIGDMDILSYIALRNNGKTWGNADFYKSAISTNDTELDYILNKCQKHIPAFVFAIYTLGTANLTANQIKAIQLGYKKLSDYATLQLNPNTRTMGDRILEALTTHDYLTSDRFNGRFAGGLKAYYKENGQNIEKVIRAINLIDRGKWERHFCSTQGKSMEIAGYADAFKALLADEETPEHENEAV